MKVHALTVCVDYADRLRSSIEKWAPSLASLTIVSTERDHETARLAAEHGARLHLTNVFYAGGALFNKGAAMEEARALMPWRDWILFIDADIVPPSNWLQQVERHAPRPGYLYGCHRRLESGEVKREHGEIAGFFQLFHSGDRIAQARPLIDCTWRHAGGYDTVLQARWGPRRRWLPMIVEHVGTHGRNWCGVGNEAQLEELMQERRRRRGFEHERLDPHSPPNPASR